MKKIIVLLCICMFVLAGCSADADMILQNDVSEEGTEALSVLESREDSSETGEVLDETADVTIIYVYVCGAVNVPGVYELSENSRIYQAIELAGGLSDDADEKSVNLAETVTDGQMIRIPSVEEAQAAQTSADTVSEVSGDTRININTANVAELTELNGIGETKAEAIIAYREAHGGFQSVDEIMQVDGIGEGTYQKIQDDIRVE